MIEDMVLQQTVMQMKHQQLLQQQLMEVRTGDDSCRCVLQIIRSRNNGDLRIKWNIY